MQVFLESEPTNKRIKQFLKGFHCLPPSFKFNLFSDTHHVTTITDDHWARRAAVADETLLYQFPPFSDIGNCTQPRQQVVLLPYYKIVDWGSSFAEIINSVLHFSHSFSPLVNSLSLHDSISQLLTSAIIAQWKIPQNRKALIPGPNVQ